VNQGDIADVPDILGSLIQNTDRLAAMRAGARSVARPDAAVRVADIVKEVADG